MTALPVLAFVVPFVASCLVGMIGLASRRAARLVALAALAVSFSLCAVAIVQSSVEGPMKISLAGWPAPLGIEWFLDPLSALMATFVSGLAFAIVGGSGAAIAREFPARESVFHSCTLLLVSGLMGMLFTADLFNLFVSLELVSLTAYGLVGAGGRGAPAAALRYLVLGSLGASLYLLGVGYVYAETGTLNSSEIAEQVALYGSDAAAIAFGSVLVVVGMGVKMALFPLHGWMAPAYAMAPPTAAALMAPLVTKVAAFALLRLLFGILDLGLVPSGRALSECLAWIGAVTILVGGVSAYRSDDLRRMLAYSSISQMGLVAIGIGIASPLALTGALFSILADAVAKSALFLAASDAVHRFRTSRVSELASLRGRAPWITVTIIVAGFSVIGLPPLCGFFGKWYVLLGALESQRYAMAAVILAGSLISAAYIFRVVERLCFSAPRPVDEEEGSGTTSSLAMPPVMLALSLLVVALGLASGPVVTLIGSALGEGGPP